MSAIEADDTIPPPLCVFCGKPWSDEMLQVLAHADVSYGDYGGVDGIEVSIDVTCSSCNRLVYRKHIQQEGQGYL